MIVRLMVLSHAVPEPYLVRSTRFQPVNRTMLAIAPTAKHETWGARRTDIMDGHPHHHRLPWVNFPQNTATNGIYDFGVGAQQVTV